MGSLVALLLGTGVISFRGAGKASGSEDPDLDALGYLAVPGSNEELARRGVTRRTAAVDPRLLVIYSPNGWSPGTMHAPPEMPWDEARLVNVDGEIVHRWKIRPFGEKRRSVFTSKLMPDGTLLTGIADVGIARLDWDSNVLWQHEGVLHHDINYDDDGNVYSLCERRIQVDFEGSPLGITDHGIAIFGPDGQLNEEVWFSEVLAGTRMLRSRMMRAHRREQERARADDPQDRDRERKIRYADVFHANTIEVLNEHPAGLWHKGDLLTSWRNLRTIAVLSRQTHKIVWQWGPGELEQQHSPTALENGHILVFDNGIDRGASRIVEVDPQTKTVTWEYRGSPEDPFYSRTRGVVEGLMNGNVMVSSSNTGRLFEVTRAGEIVWEYYAGEQYQGKFVSIRHQRLHSELLELAHAKLASAP